MDERLSDAGNIPYSSRHLMNSSVGPFLKYSIKEKTSGFDCYHAIQ